MVDNSKKSFWHKFLKRYIIVVYNQGNFKERISISLTPINLILMLSSLVVFSMLLTSMLFLYTPIKTTIPGFNNSSSNAGKVFELQNRVDSFENVERQHQIFNDTLKKILRGDTGKTSLYLNNNQNSLYRFAVWKQTEVNRQEKGIQNSEMGQYGSTGVNNHNKDFQKDDIPPILHLFPPVEGYISQHYNSEEEHYAVDLVTEKDAPVKAIDNGMVIFSEWSAETGNVIIVQHANNLISIYKHNSVILKKVGTFVNRGDVIALVGNSGELTTGPHLHFELWADGSPQDPENFISF
jgi:murein DD-endopeptidase MepM/ murein hydrolase activator NlpD